MSGSKSFQITKWICRIRKRNLKNEPGEREEEFICMVAFNFRFIQWQNIYQSSRIILMRFEKISDCRISSFSWSFLGRRNRNNDRTTRSRQKGKRRAFMEAITSDKDDKRKLRTTIVHTPIQVTGIVGSSMGREAKIRHRRPRVIEILDWKREGIDKNPKKNFIHSVSKNGNKRDNTLRHHHVLSLNFRFYVGWWLVINSALIFWAFWFFSFSWCIWCFNLRLPTRYESNYELSVRRSVE